MTGVYPPPANDEPEDLRDPLLQKALENAPDEGALPDWRMRQAILQHAHDAVAASEELLAADRQASPWWTLGWWLRRLTSRASMPWNAAFATLVVAVLATVMWHREPVPGARLDEMPAPVARESERSVDKMKAEPLPASPSADVGATASQGVVPASPDAKLQDANSALSVPPEPPPTPVAQAPAATGSTGSAVAPSVSLAPPAAPAPSAAPASAAPVPPLSPTQLPPVVPSTAPVPTMPTQSPAVVPPAAPNIAAPSAGPSANAPPATAPFAGQPPTGQPLPGQPPAATPPTAANSLARSRGAEATAKAPASTEPGAAGSPTPSALAGSTQSKTRTDATPPPSFASLSQWSEMRIANINGDVRVLPRADGGELNLLLSSAAIMAVGPQPLRALPEWRVSLERKGGVLAVLELGRDQVRWTEGGGPPATGVPPPGSLDALRAALSEAVRPPAKAAPVRKQPQRREPVEHSPAEASPEVSPVPQKE